MSIVAGVHVSGSWWAHPAGPAIYEVGERLESDPDILFVRLIRGRVTLVHRRLFSAFERVASARDSWQMTGLGEESRRLLAQFDGIGEVRSPVGSPLPDSRSAGTPQALRELGARLLIRTWSVHTPSGAHALLGEGWPIWRKRVRSPIYRASVAAARLEFEDAARRFNPGMEPRTLFPWGGRKFRGSSE